MFLGKDDYLVTLIGVFLLNRNNIRHDSFPYHYDTLGVRLDGGCTFTANNTTTKVHKGDIVYLPKNMTYSQYTESETVVAIHFLNHDPKVRQKLEVFHFDDFEMLSDTVMSMYRIWSEKKPGYKTQCTSLLYLLLHQICQSSQQNEVLSPSTVEKLEKSMDHIHTNYKNEHISIRYLAELSNVSETYFRRQFKTIYHISPNRYITNLKMEYASQMLRSHLYTVTEVSERTGYSSVKYFERVFKQSYGCTPSEFMRMNPEEFRC